MKYFMQSGDVVELSSQQVDGCLVGTVIQPVDRQVGEQMVEGVGTEFHTVFQPDGIEHTAGDFPHLLKVGQLPQTVFVRLLKHDQRLDGHTGVEAVRRGAVPGSTPGGVPLRRALNKANVPIDDSSPPVLRPAFRLRSLADTGRAEEQDSSAVVIDGGTMELEHLTLYGVGVEKSVKKRFCPLSGNRRKEINIPVGSIRQRSRFLVVDDGNIVCCKAYRFYAILLLFQWKNMHPYGFGGIMPIRKCPPWH